ncbi:hypothetical protein DOY81_001811 [Sarcophaga bullata]|nr:hypothetical protein DOY81_001811 [Sarcophaga bullata]
MHVIWKQLDNLKTYVPEPDNRIPTMIINCEWGAFGDSGNLEFLRTSFDKEVDEVTHNRCHQLYEKMASRHVPGRIG